MSPAKGPMSTEQHPHSSMPITPQPKLSRSSRSQRSLHFSWTPLVSVSASFVVVFVVSSLLIVSPSFSGVSVDAYPVIMSPNELLRKHNVMAIEIDNPEEVLSVLDNLIQSILVSIDYHQQHGTSPYQNQNNQNSMNSMAGNNQNNNNNLMQNQNNIDKSLGSKRGIDLGLSRGFSGNQAAKHLMGMSAASFANGPGRRR